LLWSWWLPARNAACPATIDLFARCATSVRALHIDAFLRDRFNCPDTHNNKAYTFYIEKQR